MVTEEIAAARERIAGYGSEIHRLETKLQELRGESNDALWDAAFDAKVDGDQCDAEVGEKVLVIEGEDYAGLTGVVLDKKTNTRSHKGVVKTDTSYDIELSTGERVDGYYHTALEKVE